MQCRINKITLLHIAFSAILPAGIFKIFFSQQKKNRMFHEFVIWQPKPHYVEIYRNFFSENAYEITNHHKSGTQGLTYLYKISLSINSTILGFYCFQHFFSSSLIFYLKRVSLFSYFDLTTTFLFLSFYTLSLIFYHYLLQGLYSFFALDPTILVDRYSLYRRKC